MHSEEPRNGIATAGLLFSIFGFSLVGIILSAIGLKRARQLQAGGDAPVGRKRSRWGLGLGIASIIISIALAVAYFLAWNQIYAFLLEQTGQTSSLTHSDSAAEVLLDDDGSPVTYDRDEVEQMLAEAFGSPGEDVICPEDVEMVVGNSFTCTFSYLGVPHEMGMTFISQTENQFTLDGVVQE